MNEWRRLTGQLYDDEVEDGLSNDHTVLWMRDDSEDYEVDYKALVLRPDGRCSYVWASGCSCWDGEAQEEVLGTLAEALSPLGVPDDVRDDEFHALSVRHDFLHEHHACPACDKDVAP